MRFGSIGARLARFRKLDPQAREVHHDALEFANGKIVLLTRLQIGQKASVLQLPAKESVEQRRLEAAQIVSEATPTNPAAASAGDR
jgi:hypothetical protein